MFRCLNSLHNYQDRNIQNTEVDGGTVDTSEVSDYQDHMFETAIQHEAYNGEYWIVVENYPTYGDAVEGHLRWCLILDSRPPVLEDVNESELGEESRGFYERRYD